MLTFRDDSIAHRTTVFEENTLVFCRKQPFPTGQRPPAGYRAVWGQRHRLAAAKLAGQIGPQTSPADFPAILTQPKGATDTDEFIEAHVYGRLDLTSVEVFDAHKPKSTDDQVLAKRARRKLENSGAKVRIV